MWRNDMSELEVCKKRKVDESVEMVDKWLW